MSAGRDVFITGATGYIGRPLVAQLLSRGHRVSALARASSVGRVPAGARVVVGDALDAATYEHAVDPACTFVQLVGTPHPSPAKAAEFLRVDLLSARQAVHAARARGVGHFVYLSVAQPAPVMQAYVEARVAAEQAIREAALTATMLRPWYVLGPGHWWPVLLIPGYAIGELLPSTRDTARRLGLVTLKQMVTALTFAVENPPTAGTMSVLDVPAIRTARID